MEPITERLAGALAGTRVTPGQLTGLGLVLGVAAAVAAAAAWWWVALALWLVGRVPDALDGPLARARGGGTARGGYLDIVADFTVYGGFVVGCAIGQPQARLALLVLLLAYYLNGTAFLAFSSAVAGRRTTGLEDGRSHVFLRGLAEGTETIVAHSLFVLFPGAMEALAWIFAAVVAVTVGQRVVLAVRVLGEPDPGHGRSS